MSITCHNIFKCFAADFTLQMQAQSPESFQNLFSYEAFSLLGMADTDMNDSVDCACQTKKPTKEPNFCNQPDFNVVWPGWTPPFKGSRINSPFLTKRTVPAVYPRVTLSQVRPGPGSGGGGCWEQGRWKKEGGGSVPRKQSPHDPNATTISASLGGETMTRQIKACPFSL